jgi:hypothetical protein
LTTKYMSITISVVALNAAKAQMILQRK